MAGPETMNGWLGLIVLAACVGGGLGGFVSAMLTGPLTKPSWMGTALDPGYLKPVVIGAVAGFLAWLPSLASFTTASHVFGAADLIGACGSAIVVGISGAKWLSAHADQQQSTQDQAQLKQALVQAVTKAPDAGVALKVAGESRVGEMLSLVRGLKDA